MELASRVSAQQLWDRHGARAYSLACALLGPEAAAEAARLAMRDLTLAGEHLSDGEARRLLARAVYRHLPAVPPAAPSAPDGHRLPRAMAWLGRLGRLQRVSLALCVHGGLTHREAAEVLDLPPAAVAELVTAGLRELRRLAGSEIASCA